MNAHWHYRIGIRHAGRLAIAVLAIATALPGRSLAAEIYLAPGGSDANPGTKERPLATLSAARDAARNLKARTQEPISVLVRGGTYRISQPVVFRPEDSGSREAPITYAAIAGEKPVITSARAIGGWKHGDRGLWAAEIPEVKQGKWYFRQLFVNGQRRPRARLPQEGLHKVAAPADQPRRSFKFQPGQIDPKWRNRDDVEIVILQYWSEARQRIASIDTAQNVVRFTGDAFRPTEWSLGWYAENVFEGLTRPGQWYLDRASGVLYYWPLPGEDVAQAGHRRPSGLALGATGR